MREIKFRGYSEDLDKWVYGDLLQYRVLPIIFDAECEQHECFHSSIGQSTGLKDKNGKEIYEGDIVRGRIYHMFPEDNVVFQIGWIDEDNGYGLHWFPKEVEVIGNIFENPELMA